MHYIYYNLHRKCWSIRNQSTRLVEGHSDFVMLHCYKAKVSEAGRQRVLKTKTKNVHAGLEGFLITMQKPQQIVLMDWQEITYNPYKYSTFVYKDTAEKFEQGIVIMLKSGKCYALKGDPA